MINPSCAAKFVRSTRSQLRMRQTVRLVTAFLGFPGAPLAEGSPFGTLSHPSDRHTVSATIPSLGGS